MINFPTVLIMSFFVAFSPFSNAEEKHDDHKEESEKEAVTLTPEAQKNFGIKTAKITPKNNQAEIPISALITSEDKKQIFIFHDGKYEIRDVTVIRKNASTITLSNFTEAEDVVISGVNYLKVVEMSHGEEGGGGHGH